MGPRYTCNSCGLGFPTSEDQRQHMKTEWHRYNLKRRVAQLPPITEEVFDAKVATMTANQDIQDEDEHLTEKEKRRRAREAILEKKNALLELARQRLADRGGEVKIEDGKLVVQQKSTEVVEEELKKGIENNIETLEGEDAKLTDDQLQEKLIQEKIDNRVEIPPEQCLFCNAHSEDLDSNVEHMFKRHGLYIPESNYLVDKAGLIEYLGEKVGYGNVCLVCQFQGRSMEAVQQHMLAKSHCNIPYDTEDEKLEIGQFYDFSSTYSDNEDEWEDTDTESEDGEVINADDLDDTMYASSYGLHLPNGLVLGHRSLARYYRQNLPPTEIELGEGQSTVVAADTRHMATAVYDKQALQVQKRAWARENKIRDLNDRHLAKHINFKAHFRDELLQ